MICPELCTIVPELCQIAPPCSARSTKGDAMKLAAAKPVVIALLALALYVPVTMIQGLVAERQARRR